MGGITASHIMAGVAVLNVLGMFGISWLMWRMRGEFVSRETFAALAARVDRMHERQVKLEGIVEHLPSNDALGKLAIAIERVGGDIRVASTQISGVMQDIERIGATLSRHEDILSTAARVAAVR